MMMIRERFWWIVLGIRHRWLMWYSPSYRMRDAGYGAMWAFREGFRSYERRLPNRLWVDHGR